MIDLSKILTISMEEYCTAKGNWNYDMVGVRARGESGHYPKTILAKVVPNNAEVVVGYSFQLCGELDYEANGTALIPKKDKQ